MNSVITNYIQKFVTLSDEELLQFASCFKEVAIKKRQYIVQPNFTAKHRNYVLNGAFRAFVVGDEGQDHTITFAINDWWITDYTSYITQQPATMFVEALENSTILQLDYQSEQMLKLSNHKFETFFRIIAERGLSFQQRRIISNLTHSAEERYEEFFNKYPQVVQSVPQYTLASYLGMTTEYLSKLRNRKTLKKQ